MRANTVADAVVGVICTLAFSFASQSASGQVLNEFAKLLPSDGEAHDHFGGYVAVSGDVVVATAVEDDDNGENSGSAYVFRWNGSSWVQEQKLLASEGTVSDAFGHGVSISGDVVILGAPGDSDSGIGSGSAYVFRWNGSLWIQEQELHGSGATSEWFGFTVSVSNDLAVVGALQEYSGRETWVYVFRWNGGTWVLEQRLLPSDWAPYDQFGISLSVSGDVVVVGSRFDDDNGTDSGSAYVFRYDASETVCGQKWCMEQKLLAPDGTEGDDFGLSVSISGDLVVVGAGRDDDNGTDSGSAYVFRYDASETICGQKWCMEQKLLASDGTQGDDFGNPVSGSNDVVVVGAQFDSDNGVNSGSVYVFQRMGSSWTQTCKLLPSDGAAGDHCANASVSGDLAVVGAGADDDNGTDSGSAYVFSVNRPCTQPPQEAEGYPHASVKQRYITFAPDASHTATAFEVADVDAGTAYYISTPRMTPASALGLGLTFVVSDVSPIIYDWSVLPQVHVGGCMIAPGDADAPTGRAYEIRATSDGLNFSSPLTVYTAARPTAANARFWADVVGSFSAGGDGSTTPPTPANSWTPPNRTVSGFDISATLQAASSASTAPHFTWTDVNPEPTDRVTIGPDVLRVVNAFSVGSGKEYYPYPYPQTPTAIHASTPPSPALCPVPPLMVELNP